MSSSVVKKIVLFGPQGSGKGTQAEELSEYFGIPHIAPGNIFRKAVADKTELGKKVEAIINAGNLVPNELTNALIHERLEQEDCIQGFVLDGYPRNSNQADALDAMTTLTHVIVIDIPGEESIRRISRRRVSSTGETYHLDFKPPKVDGICDVTGEQLFQRDDDTAEAIKKRLSIYHTETVPAFERYVQRGILHSIDGMGTIEEVWHRIQSIVN